MYNTEGFAPRDAKIIRENSGKTPYELMTEFGLSEKAYSRLLEQDDVKRQAPAAKLPETDVKPAADNNLTGDAIQPEKVEKVQPKAAKAHQPTVSSLPASSVFATLKVVGPTGIPQKMNAERARKLAAKYPNEFKIVK